MLSICPKCGNDLQNMPKIKAHDRHYLISSGARIKKSRRVIICESCGEKFYWDGARLR